MKENALKTILAAALGALGAYMGQIVVPLVVMLAVMVLDYITGLSKAWAKGDLCSKVGIQGILKKVGYLIVVAVGMVVDYIIRSGVSAAGAEWNMEFLVSLIVIVWLIINECISILENLAEIGVPVPGWLVKLIHKLKSKTEEPVATEDDKEVE